MRGGICAGACCVLAFRLQLQQLCWRLLRITRHIYSWAASARLGSYASAWLALGHWPAGPAWFLWVLLVFDCIASLSFVAIPRTVEAMASRVRAVSKRPMLLFLMLAAMSWVAYAPMSMRFGPLTWWSWGPFAVQASRVLHYFVYFAMGVCLGAFGLHIEIFERTGRLARRWWFWCLLAALMLMVTIVCVRARNATGGMIGFACSCAASSLFVTALVFALRGPGDGQTA